MGIYVTTRLVVAFLFGLGSFVFFPQFFRTAAGQMSVILFYFIPTSLFLAAIVGGGLSFWANGRVFFLG